MSEKIIEGKQFFISPINPEERKIIFTTRTIGRVNSGKFFPPEGQTSSPIIVSAKITKEQYDSLVNINSPLAYAKENNFYVDYAEIRGNNISLLSGVDETIDGNSLRQIKENAINDSNLSIKSNNLVNNSNTTQNTSTESTSSSVENTTANSVNFTKKREGNVLVYPTNMSDGQDCMEFTIFEYENRNITNAGNTLKPFESTGGGNITKGFKQASSQSVYLPITKISDNNSVNWQEDQLNEFQRYLANLSLGIMQGGDAGTMESSVNTALEGAKSLFNFATGDAFGNYVRSYLAGQAVGVNNLVTRSTGAILNPNMELLFNGPLLRPFSFGFDMIGKNREEASVIKSIIKFFKKNMAVRETATAIDSSEANANTAGQRIAEGNSVFLNSPLVFRIRYLQGSGSGGASRVHKSIGQIKMCALQNCTVDYTPLGSYMTFNDEENTMFMYRIALSFKELTPIYNTDYLDDHSIGF